MNCIGSGHEEAYRHHCAHCERARDEKAFWLMFLRSRRFLVRLRMLYLEEHGDDFPPDMLALYEDQLKTLDLIRLTKFKMRHARRVIDAS